MRVHPDFSRLLLACLLVSAPVACSESHDTLPSDQLGSGDRAGRGGSSGSSAGRGGGSGRAGSTAGAGGRAATGRGGSSAAAGAGAATVSCGGETCTSSSVFGFTLAACCAPEDKCGLDLSVVALGSCSERDAPGRLDSACPSQTLGGLLTLMGCCRPDNTCGTMASMFGLGCVAVTVGGSSATSCEY